MRYFLHHARIVSVFSVSLIVLSAPAIAQTQQQSNWCQGKDSATPDMMISACSASIQAGKLTDQALAEAFYRRGIAYNRKRQYPRAIEDFDQAIRLNPNFAAAYGGRGNAYTG